MKKFNLLEFKFHNVDGMLHARFVIKIDGEQIERDEMLKMENKEDVALLKSIETFIRSRAVK